MDRNKENIAISALYCAGVWRWAALPQADIVTPPEALPVFRFVNAYLFLYRLINPRTYSLRHQLLHRHTAIDSLIERSGCNCVIELACGFSPRGAHFSADPDVEYIELDLPDLVASKRRRLQGTDAGRRILARPNFHLGSGDVHTHDFATRHDDRKTAVVTEGLMMYLTRVQQLPIWARIAARLRRSGGIYLFDYIPPAEEPARSWLGRLLHIVRVKVLRIRGDFAYDHRDRRAIADDLRSAGFSQVEDMSTGDVAVSWGLPQSAVRSHTIIYCCQADPVHSGAHS